MKLSDALSLTLKSLAYRRLRSWLTIIGVIIGIASVVGLMTFSESISASITKQLSVFQADKLIIAPGSFGQTFSRTTAGGQFGTPQVRITTTTENELTDNDLKALKNLPDVVSASGVISEHFDVGFRGEVINLNTQFIDPSAWNIINQFEIEDGRLLTDSDKVTAVIGDNVGDRLFKNDITAGDVIQIDGINIRVVGVLVHQGGYLGTDDTIFINRDVANSFVDQDNLDTIELKASSAAIVDQVESAAEELLMRLHHVVEPDFSIITFGSIQQTVQSIIGLITVLLSGIAAISLVVGAIGISNTMFTSVLERTREIGIMKAIGAKRSDIMVLFIAEAAFMSLIGGFMGMALGLVAAYGLFNFLVETSPTFGAAFFSMSTDLILISIAFSTGIGVLSGFLPARRAAQLDPIDALRYA